MRSLIRGAQFRRDVKLAGRRDKDLSKLRELILLWVEGQPLPPQYRDHPLSGGWKHYRDCHIEPDWLLIYKIEATICTWSAPERTLTYSRAGVGHSPYRAILAGLVEMR